MKKIITILFLIPFALQGQTWKVNFNQPDKQAHIAAGYFTGVVFNFAAYDVLKDTRLKPFWAKFWSTLTGIAGGIIIGDLKEKYDRDKGGYYNRKDFNATLYGAVGGSITVRLVLWGSIPISKVPEGKMIYDSRLDIPKVYFKKSAKQFKRKRRKQKKWRKKFDIEF